MRNNYSLAVDPRAIYFTIQDRDSYSGCTSIGFPVPLNGRHEMQLASNVRAVLNYSVRDKIENVKNHQNSSLKHPFLPLRMNTFLTSRRVYAHEYTYVNLYFCLGMKGMKL